MDDVVRALLERVKSGATSVDDAMQTMSESGAVDLGFASVDVDREARTGAPEVIFGERKTPSHIAAIAQTLLERGQNVLVTRAPAGASDAVRAIAADVVVDEVSRTLVVKRSRADVSRGRVGVISAGTSDLPVSREVSTTLSFLDVTAVDIVDVGVAGIDRILHHRERLRTEFDGLVVVAGMDGALPSVVTGLVSCPVIAVPTSVGYGASFGGVAALLTMLSSCASGLVVVNIDNGFGAASAMARILRRRSSPTS